MPLCQTIFVVTWWCWDTSHQLFWGFLIVILHMHLLLLHTLFASCSSFCGSKGGRRKEVWQHRAAHLSSFGIQPCLETLGRCAMPGDPLEQLHFWEKLCLCTSSVLRGAIKVSLPLIPGLPSLSAAYHALLIFHLHTCPKGMLRKPPWACEGFWQGQHKGLFFHPPPSKRQEHIMLVFLNTLLKCFLNFPRNQDVQTCSQQNQWQIPMKIKWKEQSLNRCPFSFPKGKVQTAFDSFSFSTKTNIHFNLCLNDLKCSNIPLLYCSQTFKIPAKYLFWIVSLSNSSFYQ